MEKINTEKRGYLIKIRRGDLEFKVSGDKQFVIEYYEQLKEMFSLDHLNNIEDSLKPAKKEIPSKLITKNLDDIDIPLDVYFRKYDTEGLQQKFLTTALYLLEIKKMSSFRSNDVNEILRENKYEPFQSASTHIRRLRDKGLISIIGKEGKESILTIYKDNIEHAKDFIKITET